MVQPQEKLVRCFQAVFPGLSADEAAAASVDSVPEWDSLASLTLVAVIEEEYDVVIEEDRLPELGSFNAIHAYLGERAAAEPSS